MNDSQIPLNFKQNPQQTFAQFVVGDNASLIKSIQTFNESNEALFYLWGKPGSGKSHILQATIENISSQNKSAVIISPNDITNRENISLLEMFTYICIDGVENIAGNKQQEEALFYWINEIRQTKKKLILASQISNKSDNWQLPDLRSRLQAGITYGIKRLGRSNALKVFKRQAKDKGIKLDDKIINYLQNNYPTDMNFLNLLLNNLDQITLIQKKPVTIPLIKKITQTILEK